MRFCVMVATPLGSAFQNDSNTRGGYRISERGEGGPGNC